MQTSIITNESFSFFKKDEINQSIPTRFEKIAKEYPGKVAIRHQNLTCTYNEVNKLSNRLARVLLRENNNYPITLLFNHCPSMAIAIMGVLKANKSWVAIAPDDPRTRVKSILSDSGSLTLITNNSNIEAADRFSDSNLKIINIDEIDAQIVSDNINLPIESNSIACILYTSGTTGVPKGIVQTHQNFLFHVMGYTNAFYISPKDKWGLIATYTHIAGIADIFRTILNGAELNLYEIKKRGFDDIPQWLIDEEISIYHSAPMVFQKWAESLNGNKEFPNLRMIHLGGDKITIEHVGLYRMNFPPNCILLNHFGCTEAYGFSRFLINMEAEIPERYVPMGNGIDEMNLLIINGDGKEVGVDEVGEITIFSQYLSPGYWKKPRTTAEAFIPFHKGITSGLRGYRTGDLARYTQDGKIEFLGRKDFQVKIHGNRVELGEIESSLKDHNSINDCVVEVKIGPQGEKELVGYVILERGKSLDITIIRAYLIKRLPGYMIPTKFVSLDNIPLSPNGKVDRNALPDPDDLRPFLNEGFRAPKNILEEKLAGIWSEILGIKPVGVNENFFELGGHSISAAKMISRLRSSLGIVIPFQVLFDNPSIAELSTAVDASSKNRFNLLEMQIPGPELNNQYPISYPQERLWFIYQLQNERPSYNVPDAFHLKGFVDHNVLTKSFQEIVHRHDSLRTLFKIKEGRLIQDVQPEILNPLSIIDLRTLADDKKQRKVLQLLKEFSQKSFDLMQEPPVRGKLIQLNSDEHILYIDIHHIVCDAWSKDVFYEELSQIFGAYLSGESSPLDDLVIQYGEYSKWQRTWYENDQIVDQLNYFKRKLREPSRLNLPTDRVRPEIQTYQGDSEILQLSDSLLARIKNLSNNSNVSVFITLITAFNIFLARLSGQDDIFIGIPTAGRNHAEFEKMIGLFLNHLVIRTDTSGNPTFQNLLTQVRQTALEAYANQDVPFERIVENLQPGRDLSRTNLFQVFFNMHHVGEKDLVLDGVKTKKLVFKKPNANFDITLYVREIGSRILLEIVYNTDLFNKVRIKEMLSQYHFLLDQIVSAPNKEILYYSLATSEAEIILPDPSQPIADEWQGTVHARVAKHSLSNPDHTAVVSSQEDWTYQELDRLSSKLGNFLLSQGIQPADVIAIYAHRGASLVLSILGIQKAGAAFLILDPDYPPLRLAEYVQKAGIKGFINLSETGNIPDAVNLQLKIQKIHCQIEIPQAKLEIFELLSEYSLSIEEIGVGPEDLACVSFTSGSTGTPKGVLGKFGSLSHFMPWQIQKFRLNSSDRFSMTSGLSHDPLQREIFTPLWIGATICIPDPDKIASPGYLGKWILTEKITFAHLTPAISHFISKSADPSTPTDELRVVFLVGDKLTRDIVKELRYIFPQADIFNTYGSTETQRAISYYPIAQNDVESEFVHPVLPIGKGIPDVQLLILNECGGLAGVGELGEMYIRSPHIALGYLNDPESTRDNFICNPFTKLPSDLIYKTGDLGRYLPDGNAAFVGRKDHQVKIRGYRIEIGEIEEVLKQNFSIQESVVIPRIDKNIITGLTAYIIPEQDETPEIYQLRKNLQKKLPSYMIPSAFIVLDTFPVTPGGKVDRDALPSPDCDIQLEETPYIGPTSPIESQMVAIWEEVLDTKPIGVYQNFFDLGGHSLLATQIINRVTLALNIRIPLLLIFETPTVAEIARWIEENTFMALEKK